MDVSTHVRPSPRSWQRVVLVSALATACGDHEAAVETEGDSHTGDPVVVDPTWHRDIAPLITARCGACHRDGGIAPFSLASYEAAAPWAEQLLAAAESGSMPPFAADETDTCQPRLPWRDDPRLSEHELELLRVWVEDGAPAGDASDPAPLPPIQDSSLADADLRLVAGPVEITGDEDRFYCFVLDPQLDADRYLRATQIVPGNPRVVHHALVFADPDDHFSDNAGADGWFECKSGGLYGDALVAMWAPGGLPQRTPEGVATRLRAGTKLVMSVHYHPTGGVELDPGTALELEWYEGEPELVSELALVGNFYDEGLLPGPNDPGYPRFRIPAGAEHHTELMALPLPPELPELRVWMVGGHMHYLGVDLQLSVIRPGAAAPSAEQECLLQTPRYQFEWQRTYAYDAGVGEVPVVRGGDTLLIRCAYNNSLSNPALVELLAGVNADAPMDVTLGEGSFDEMCLGVFGVAYPPDLEIDDWRP